MNLAERIVITDMNVRLADLKVIERTLKLGGITTVDLRNHIRRIEQQVIQITNGEVITPLDRLPEEPIFLDPQVEAKDILVVPSKQDKVRCKGCGEIILFALNQTKGFQVWFHEHNKMQQCYVVMPIATPDI